MTTRTIASTRMRWWHIADVMRIEAELFGDEQWTDTMFWSELAQRDTRHYIVVPDQSGAVIAYAGLCAYPPHESYVQTIAVSKPSQGKGIGSALVHELIDESERRGCRRLDLEVRADNSTAIGLYERHGFSRVGVRRGYYQPSGTDALVMRREPT